jgi:hypothetical protein
VCILTIENPPKFTETDGNGVKEQVDGDRAGSPSLQYSVCPRSSQMRICQGKSNSEVGEWLYWVIEKWKHHSSNKPMTTRTLRSATVELVIFCCAELAWSMADD